MSVHPPFPLRTFIGLCDHCPFLSRGMLWKFRLEGLWGKWGERVDFKFWGTVYRVVEFWRGLLYPGTACHWEAASLYSGRRSYTSAAVRWEWGAETVWHLLSVTVQQTERASEQMATVHLRRQQVKVDLIATWSIMTPCCTIVSPWNCVTLRHCDDVWMFSKTSGYWLKKKKEEENF